MAKRYHINLFLDPELGRALENHMAESGIDNRSAVVRDLLRHALGVVGSKREAGWREGYQAGLAEVRKTVGDALRKLTGPGT